MTTWESPTNLLPDLPGKVHGIVSLDPPTIQCDGCGITRSRDTLAGAVLFSGIRFDGGFRAHDSRRLCEDCRDRAGWRKD